MSTLLAGLGLLLSILALASSVATDRRLGLVAQRVQKLEGKDKVSNPSRYLLVGRSCPACHELMREIPKMSPETRRSFLVLAGEEYEGADLVSAELFATVNPGYLPSFIVRDEFSSSAFPVTSIQEVTRRVHSS
jgi:hypothetical protein